MSTNTRSKADQVVQVTQLITGTQKRFPNGSQQLSFGNATHTVSDVTNALQTFVTNRAAVTAAETAAKVALDNANAASPALLALIAAYTKFVRATFGTSADALADFGLTPPKAPVPKTAVQKAVAAAKAKATRQARGTTSAKQKQAVKGNVTAQLVVTSVAPAASSTASPPVAAPSASPAAGTAAATPTGGTPTAHS